MSLQGQSKIKKGVTIIELLIVLAVVIVIGAATIPMGASFLERNALRNKVNEIATSLKVAQVNSMSGKRNSAWGVNVDSAKITLFQGDSFASRDQTFDRTYAVPSSVSITNFEVVFDRNNGNPSQTISISVSNTYETKNIVLNQVGNVDIQ